MTFDRQKARDEVLAKLNKEYGDNTIGMYKNMPKLDIQTVPTGSLRLDIALGVGGLPRGRIIEIYGPFASGKTTLTLHAIAEVQKLGGAAAFIDAEHALDPVYAGALGVDMDKLYLTQPMNGEQALNTVKELVLSNGFDIIVVDSIASLVPKKELDGEIGDQHMGLQARMLGQAMRILAGSVAKTKTTLVFINQLRMKIGVMFGCFNYNTRICLADGTTQKIGKIVNNKLAAEVLSMDPDTGRISNKKIVNWFNNGNADQFLQFKVEKCGGNGSSQFGVTSNHVIMTPKGSSLAKNLRVNDDVLIKAEKWFTPLQKEVAVGSILGDGNLKRSGKNTKLRIGHGKKQIEYAKWKSTIFKDLISYSGPNSVGGWNFELKPTYDCTPWHLELYKDSGRVVTESFLSELSLLSLAIWYLDDGCFSGYYTKWGHGKVEISVKQYCEADRHKLANCISRLLGEENKPTVTTRGTLLFSGNRTGALHKSIAKFVPPCMNYKLHPKYRNMYESLETQVNLQPSCLAVPGKILDIHVKPKTRSMKKFDLEIEDNHTYLVDGTVVHNSPETTPGGESLKFYSSVRIDIRKAELIKNGDEAIGAKTKCKVVKNKVALPFTHCEFDIIFGKGIDKAGEILDTAVELDMIEKVGAWYKHKGAQLGQGRDNTIVYLKEHPDLLTSFEKQIRTHFKLD
jgi:recombination protein RecA